MQPAEYTSTGSVYTSPSENFQLYLGGYWQGDFMSFYHATPLKGDANWRAGVTSVELAFVKAWQFYLSYDFAISRLYDLYLSYAGSDYFWVYVGQFSPIFGLANASDTSAITMLELPLPVIAFSPPYYMPGIEIGIFKSPFALVANFFGPSLGSTVHGRNPYGAMINVVFSPIHTQTKVIHVALSTWEQGVDSEHNLSLFPAPELYAANNGSLIGVDINHVSTDDVLDGAIVGLYDSFCIQGEYLYSWVNRNAGYSSPQFSGYYVTASYFLTGESRLYDFQQVSFSGISPIKGRLGAWQLAMQFSEVNLANQDVQGGREYNYSIGLNWYPIRFMEFLLDYIHAVAVPNSEGVNQTANMYALRIQFMF